MTVQLLAEVLYDGGPGLENIVRHIFPISSGLAWFACIYLAIYAFLPFIQKVTSWLNEHRSQYDLLIGMLLVMESIVGFVTPLNTFYSTLLFGFVTVLLGDWIRPLVGRIRKSFCLLGVVSGWVCAVFGTAVLMIASERIPAFEPIRFHFVANNSPFVILVGVSLVLLFASFHFHSKKVNALAGMMFSVYLAHSNSVVRDYVWIKWLNVPGHLDELWLYLLFCLAALFVVGCLSDVM